MISYIITAVIGVTALWTAIKHFFPWLAYDIEFFGFISRSFSILDAYEEMDPIYTVTSRLTDRALESPDKAFILFKDDSFTYKQINDRANQIARAVRTMGVESAETVGMLMTNGPDFITTWFGIQKAGAIPSFINCNLRGATLMHCVRVSECSKLIVSSDDSILRRVKDLQEKLADIGVTIFVCGNDVISSGPARHHNLSQLADKELGEQPPNEWTRSIKMSSHFCYTFTSGTTGMPKAAIITHMRAWMAAFMFRHARLTSHDVIYTTLPLYHGSALLLGILGAIDQGCTVLLRKKFSVHAFWDDCRQHNVTVIHYIGEIMRYLCNQPRKEDDKHHSVRIAFGNGLAVEVWQKFLDRFGERIVVSEFYNSTEGNIGYYNVKGIFGRIGQSSPLYNFLCGLAFIKYDVENDCPVLGEDGRCVRVPIGEPGLIIAKIRPRLNFLGYRGNRKMTEKKILRNVFKNGDKYFNSGDIVLRHRDYSVSFVDRVGDTFRWKGENVSTYEVSDIMANAPSIAEANVYGVKVPGTEGRAGMMAAVLDPSHQTFDCKAVYRHACASLPPYARPLFVRIRPEMKLTSTWKQVKTKLAEEGFDPAKTGGDPLFIMDAKNATYSLLTQEIVHSLKNSAANFQRIK